MGGEWHRSPLAAGCERVSVGHVGLTSEFFCGQDEGVPLLRSQNVRPGRLDLADVRYVIREFHQKSRKSQLQGGDILFVRVGQNRGDCCVVPEGLGDLNCANVVFARPRKGLSRFLGYYFQSPVGQRALQSISTGSAQGVLNTKSIASLEVPLPPTTEAEAIAHILGTLDDKIELNRRMNETLEAMAQALFKSWFVDFDPVRAKCRGTACRAPTLPQSIADLFPDSFEDSELGEIPKGWEVKTLGELLELAYGKALKADNREHGTVPVYGSNGQIGWHDEKLLSGPGIVVGRKGNPGIVTWSPTDFFPIDTTFYVIPKEDCRSLHFLFHALQTHELASLGADSAVPGLNRNLAYMNKQVVPSAQLREKFDQAARVLFERIHQGDKESRILVVLRDTLLPKLISGELRVKDAERVVKETV